MSWIFKVSGTRILSFEAAWWSDTNPRQTAMFPRRALSAAGNGLTHAFMLPRFLFRERAGSDALTA